MCGNSNGLRIKDICSKGEQGKQQRKLWIGVIGALFTMGMSIWSFASASNAYKLLDDMKGDYEVHIEHWDALPVIDIEHISKTDECKPGWETPIWSPTDRNALQTIGQFPGSLPWCECGSTFMEYIYTITEYRCDCGSGRSKDGKDYATTSWGSGQCSGDAVSAGCSTGSQQTQFTHQYTTVAGVCHANATKAGCRDDVPAEAKLLEIWKNDRKLCYKRGGWSAMERIDHIGANGACDSGVACQSADAGESLDLTICAPKEEECPLIDLGDIATAMMSGTALDYSTSLTSSKALPIVEIQTTIGSPCWRGKWGQSGRPNNERVADKFNKGCDKEDSRFDQWDTIAESDLYTINGVGTSGNVLLGDGQRSAVQHYDQATTVQWRMSYRHEIKWNDDCSAGDIHELSDHLKPLRKVVGYQNWLLVINGIFGLFILGICIPITMLMHACDKDHDVPCIPGAGEVEQKRLKWIQKIVSALSKVAKMIPLILCLVVTDSIHSFFKDAGAGKCSDDLTNESMFGLAEEIDRVKKSNYMTLIVDIVMIVVFLLSVAWELYSKCCKKEDDASGNEGAEEGNNQEPVEMQPEEQPLQNQFHEAPRNPQGVVLQPQMVPAQPQMVQPQAVQYGAPMQGQPVQYGAPMQGQPVQYGAPMQGQPVQYQAPMQPQGVQYEGPLTGNRGAQFQ